MERAKDTPLQKLDQFKQAVADHQAGTTAMVLNIHISDKVISATMRRGIGAKH